MDIEDKKKKVSYSQFSKWYSCARRFYWDKVMKKEIKDSNLNTCFGTAIHEAIQEYIKKLYTEGATFADSLDLNKMFKEAFDREIAKDNVKSESEEYSAFVMDAVDILRTFVHSPNRTKHFPTGKYEFIDVELEIEQNILNNVSFIAYIDLVLKDKSTGRIKIVDIKTSTNGWNKWQKEDNSKLYQLLLYKLFYAKKFQVDPKNIDIEFFILKRKLMENVSFPQSRIQIVKPKDDKREMIKCSDLFVDFIKDCFDSEGKHKTDINIYPRNPGKAKKNCKYCSHHKTLCDGKSDVDDD